MENKVLIILGMHRSGTSFVAKNIHDAGLSLGDKMLGSNIGNINGHYEDFDFHDFHEAVFKENNIHYGGFDVSSKIKLSQYDKKKANEIIRLKNSKNKEWGWKDPRTCLFIDLWDSNIINKKYLIIFRDYNSVVSSLINRDFNTIYANRTLIEKIKKSNNKIVKEIKKDYIISWIKYNTNILDFIKYKNKNDYIVINFENIQNRMKDILIHLNEKWHFKSVKINNESNFDKKQITTKQVLKFDSKTTMIASNIMNILLYLETY